MTTSASRTAAVETGPWKKIKRNRYLVLRPFICTFLTNVVSVGHRAYFLRINYSTKLRKKGNCKIGDSNAANLFARDCNETERFFFLRKAGKGEREAAEGMGVRIKQAFDLTSFSPAYMKASLGSMDSSTSCTTAVLL